MLCLILYFILVLIVNFRNVTKIRRGIGSESAVVLRSKILRNRRIVFAISVGLHLLIAFVYNTIDFNDWFSYLFSLFMAPIVLYIYLKMNNSYDEALGNISTYTKDEFISNYSHDKYALYLRAFERDNYSEKRKWFFRKFSECEFAAIVQKKMQLCAVGMTKEIDSPNGAIRLYLNDEKWKKDVLDLMQESLMIYILVDDRESCIWEIIQSRKFIDKTVFIVDNIDKYNSVIGAVKEDVSLPKIDNALLSKKQIAVVRYINESFTVMFFDNSRKGYEEMLCTIGT